MHLPMFTHATPASPALATSSTSSAPPPTSPSRPSRLRGLSYLSRYTHNLHSSHSSHSSHSREQSSGSTGSPTTTQPPNTNAGGSNRQSLTRATSYPTESPAANERQFESPVAAPVQESHNQSGTMTMSSETAQRQPPFSQSMDTFSPVSDTDSMAAQASSPVRTSNGPAHASTMPPPPVRQTSSSNTNGVRQTGSNPELGRSASTPSPPTLAPETRPTIRFTQHQDARAPRPSLVFSPMGRTLPTGTEVIKVGRYSERETNPHQPANMTSAAPVGFKSKVVSRRHCEFWVENGQWYIRDVKSSSGTFLNHVRLSNPNTESKPYPLRDGDIIQLGIDFKGGEEMIFRCVKIRVELNRGWQASLNQFNVASHQRLRKMVRSGAEEGGGSNGDCAICLCAVAPCQSLFVAPCSHTWHFKCVRRMLTGPSYPNFICPNCRAVADLEAEIEEMPLESEWEDIDAVVAQSSANAAPLTESPTSMQSAQHPQPTNVLSVLRRTGSGTAQDESMMNDSAMVGNDFENSSPRLAVTNLAPGDSTSLLQLMAARVPEMDPVSSVQEASAGNSIEATATTPTQPMAIAPNGRQAERRGEDMDGERGARGSERTETRTPSAERQRAALEAVENPMTPRNDEGPFVFDGRGSRELTRPHPA